MNNLYASFSLDDEYSENIFFFILIGHFEIRLQCFGLLNKIVPIHCLNIFSEHRFQQLYNNHINWVKKAYE